MVGPGSKLHMYLNFLNQIVTYKVYLDSSRSRVIRAKSLKHYRWAFSVDILLTTLLNPSPHIYKTRSNGHFRIVHLLISFVFRGTQSARLNATCAFAATTNTGMKVHQQRTRCRVLWFCAISILKVNQTGDVGNRGDVTTK